MRFNSQKNLRAKCKQSGSVIIFTLLIMLSVMVISIALMRLLIPKFKIIRESIYSVVAVYAADSGMEWCIFANRNDLSAMSIAPGQPVNLQTIPGVTIQIYGPSGATCLYSESSDYRTVGSYNGISRSLEVF
ncbi:MAG: hypothetical protein A3B91_03615 [Candidatus Yanofskybacteria bacterium RIFCSPHIGHO2_02_FULL_41_29]|uniref:Uncharacterized protein n=1 Tax=Candidatus Yanofskybacteria bacterium RIFCSPHIGHO2_01_FULL_41_53 TaxID=1802663 RepID=A0A1F8EKR2_9BACT|nr:MAG: hypothetical protein A2650_00730 [Candidatus Yanofskybacteria bacterium RIFCSPHIGHO2_01_FULL_41_53]OGN10846.1 MAG: hypothetical protein A3B91_03615 [Candidatus Yanofskybacteria bacterium RIFCSPHIGHO2_02_FULL_41_29]OGN18542.1 MAG: hypothetical protein A3F48_01200 [Candidatus Yanofskybacteria bacterium RIFCSPHIGHO2_12_FULL_41_9]OGN24490.1 MAG: hypothetical protein A2916_02565 [Candidatus Yanofskybacteria bacterium RIFCSPLOWO2_01_FULL_41_67]OGN29515.1 MAG: hypothetical protein A3H54_01255 